MSDLRYTVVTVRGEEFVVTGRRIVTGTGVKFDGRVRFTLQRVADGARFAWLGGRGAQRVPANARLVAEQAPAAPLHAVTVGWVADNHGYPYRAACTCGWESRTYAATHAAQMMADDHLANVKAVQ